MEGVLTEGRRIFAVGDIHGCLDRLRQLLRRLPLEPGDGRLIFVGDYINRGPDSRGVIDCLLEIRDRRPDTVFLLGNHEHALLEYGRTGDVEGLRLLRRMGVEATLKSYDDAPVASLGGLAFLPAEHRLFLESLRPFYRQDGYLFVHAGVAPGRDPDTAPIESLLTVRGAFWEAEPAGPATVVFGHSAFETPLVAPGRIGIDTGAVYGNMLTAVELPRLRFYHA